MNNFRRSDPSPLNGTTQYVYDGWQVVEERDGQGAVTAVYTYGNYIDEPLTFTSAQGTLYYHTNNMYNVRALTDENGAVVERYRYSAYGEVTILDPSDQEISESAVGNVYMFQGRRHDPETGLYYYRNRMMSADLGRFLQTDPLGYVDGYNLYEFVGGHVVNAVDPMGLFMTPQIAGLNWFYRLTGSSNQRVDAITGAAPDTAAACRDVGGEWTGEVCCYNGRAIDPWTEGYDSITRTLRDWRARLNKLLWGTEINMYESMKAIRKSKEEGTFHSPPIDWQEVGGQVAGHIPPVGVGGSFTIMFQNLGFQINIKEDLIGDSHGLNLHHRATSTAFGYSADFSSNAYVDGAGVGLGNRHIGAGIETGEKGSSFNLHFGTGIGPPVYFTTPDLSDDMKGITSP